jgi:hypothetical protein
MELEERADFKAIRNEIHRRAAIFIKITNNGIEIDPTQMMPLKASIILDVEKVTSRKPEWSKKEKDGD